MSTFASAPCFLVTPRTPLPHRFLSTAQALRIRVSHDRYTFVLYNFMYCVGGGAVLCSVGSLGTANTPGSVGWPARPASDVHAGAGGNFDRYLYASAGAGGVRSVNASALAISRYVSSPLFLTIGLICTCTTYKPPPPPPPTRVCFAFHLLRSVGHPFHVLDCVFRMPSFLR